MDDQNAQGGTPPDPRADVARQGGRAMAVLADLWREDLGLTDIASRHGVSLAALARWAARDRTIRMMERLRDLVSLRAGLLAARARAEASESLRRLANDRSNPETARKACVDLLKIAPEPTPRHEPPAATDAGNESIVRGLLEKLGGEGADRDPGSEEPE